MGRVKGNHCGTRRHLGSKGRKRYQVHPEAHGRASHLREGTGGLARLRMCLTRLSDKLQNHLCSWSSALGFAHAALSACNPHPSAPYWLSLPPSAATFNVTPARHLPETPRLGRLPSSLLSPCFLFSWTPSCHCVKPGDYLPDAATKCKLHEGRATPN